MDELLKQLRFDTYLLEVLDNAPPSPVATPRFGRPSPTSNRRYKASGRKPTDNP
jgi:hypothetical protein